MARDGHFVGRAGSDDIPAELPSSLQWSRRPDVLRPRPTHAGRRGTFTAHHGFGQFPWHTDGAIADQPPRYILLCSPTSSKTPTDILTMRPGVPAFEALRDLVLYTKFIRPRYFRAVDPGFPEPRVRWDPDKLAIASPSRPDPSALEPEPDMQIKWRKNTVALIDNWRCLHRRPKLFEKDEDRVLLRSYIFERQLNV